MFYIWLSFYVLKIVLRNSLTTCTGFFTLILLFHTNFFLSFKSYLCRSRWTIYSIPKHVIHENNQYQHLDIFFSSGVPQRLDAGDLGRPTRYCYLESIYHTWDGGTDHRASLVSHPIQCVAVLEGLHWAGSTDRLINPPMRCSTWRGNDLTKLNRQVQLWVCPRFEPPTPHLCTITYTGREPVFLLSFIPSASCRSNSFTILSPSPLRGVETPQQVYQPQTDPEYPLKLSSQ